MYINTGIGDGWAGHKVSVSTSFNGKFFELVIFQPVDYAGGCHWVGVSLSPAQAINIAGLLINPPEDKWVDYADPAPEPEPQGEIRKTWSVSKVKHKNGVYSAYIGITKNEVAINTSMVCPSPKRTCVTDYFWYEHSEELTSPETTKLAGILYHWAGAMMIGYKKRKRVEHYESLLLVDKEEPEFA